jgi:cytochrome c551/c552
MGRRVKLALGGLVAVLVLMQVVRFEHTNPPVTGEVKAPDDVKALLKRACWDCHSNETVWPWYSQVAPGSWLIANDVKDGRKHLNFSEWGTYPVERRTKKQAEVADEVEEGGMPPWFYLPLHAEAKLTDAEKQKLIAWSKGPVSE